MFSSQKVPRYDDVRSKLMENKKKLDKRIFPICVIILYIYIYIYIYMCVCVCVWERERESEREKKRKWVPDVVTVARL